MMGSTSSYPYTGQNFDTMSGTGAGGTTRAREDASLMEGFMSLRMELREMEGKAYISYVMAVTATLTDASACDELTI